MTAEPVTVPGGSILVGDDLVDVRVTVLREPLSFWGGFDSVTGRIIDRHHPQVGEVLTDLVVCLPASRGSSSASSTLAEAVRAGTAPRALILRVPDPILILGAVVADELYGRCPTIALVPRHTVLRDGDRVTITAGKATE